MTYDEIVEESKQDILDREEVDLDTESLRIPHLHQKWSMILMEEKMRMRAIERKQSSWIRIMFEYYTGKLDKDELDGYNLKPFGLKILRSDIDKYLNSDAKLNDMQDRYVYQQNVVAFVERKLKEISTRQWNIKAAIEHRKFMSGG